MNIYFVLTCVFVCFSLILLFIICILFLPKRNVFLNLINKRNVEFQEKSTTMVDYRSLLNKHLANGVQTDNVSDMISSSEIERMNKFLDSSTELIIKHISDPKYSVIRLSQDMFMDRSGFYKKIKKAAKCTPKAFIRNIRLNYVAGLIEQEKYSYEEIAKMSGFESINKLILECPRLFDQKTNKK